jgi:transmembrane sensor
MSTREPRTEISEQILAEACGWFIDCNEGEFDAAGRERFNEWLRRSPVHVRAYMEIAAAWEDSVGLKGAQTADPTALVDQALADTNVVPFDPRATGSSEVSSAPDPRAPRGIGGGRLPWLFFAVAAAALVAVGIGFLNQRNTYITGIGEQRSIVLDDGSTVELNARSGLRVHFSHADRTVDVIDGQALFRVKKDATRPFVVVSSGTRVRAVGTQFDVYRKATGTTVTVVEGRVSVTDATETPVFLSAGEQVTVSPRAIPHAVRADIAVATAWTQRKLVFNETPLSEVVTEFNRYNSHQMIIEDASLAAYHIGGHFEAGDPNRLIQFLRERFDVNVSEHGDEIRISRK